MHTLYRILPRAGLALGLAGLLFAAPLAAATQASSVPTIMKLLRDGLRSEDASRQEQALVDVIALANCPASCTVALQSAAKKHIRIENETGAGSIVDFEALIPDLQAAYRTGPADGHRLLALAALIKIGDARALEQLVTDKEAQGSTVQDATNRSLVSFYLAKYPELTERAVRSGTLTIESVQRAEALRLRRAAKSSN
jgi:hypothetical protein